MVMKSKHRESFYKGIPIFSAYGLHEKAFEVFSQHVPTGSRVLELGCGPGAFTKRLLDHGYEVMPSDLDPKISFDRIARRIDLNIPFRRKFNGEQFDAACLIEVLEHVENPRHVLRELLPLLKNKGILFVSTPNASGLYSRMRFFFTGEMASFTDSDYRGKGHMTPLTFWHLRNMFKELPLEIIENRFYDGPFMPPNSLGDVAKAFGWIFMRPLMFGKVGGSNLIFVLRKVG
ncbi:MAG: class I SAM-dependent methyltransferase [Planctomycetota bacterium]|jgi:SAM-dependent methyltransferase